MVTFSPVVEVEEVPITTSTDGGTRRVRSLLATSDFPLEETYRRVYHHDAQVVAGLEPVCPSSAYFFVARLWKLKPHLNATASGVSNQTCGTTIRT